MSSNVVWHDHRLTKEQRAEQKSQRPCLIWFTGLSGSGKSTMANLIDEYLYKSGHHTYVLDGDNVRHGLNKDLGFSDADRVENIRRIGEVSKLFVDAGVIVLSAFISPFAAERTMVRELLQGDEFVEVYVKAPLQVCEQRDPKGLYKKARAGEIKNFTGIGSKYEAPENPELVIETDKLDVEACAQIVIDYLKSNGFLVQR